MQPLYSSRHQPNDVCIPTVLGDLLCSLTQKLAMGISTHLQQHPRHTLIHLYHVIDGQRSIIIRARMIDPLSPLLLQHPLRHTRLLMPHGKLQRTHAEQAEVYYRPFQL